MDRALRTCAGLLEYIKRSADSGIIWRKADLGDAAPEKQSKASY